MAGAPHTSCQKGKRVLVRLKNGKRIVGKFIEKKGRYVYLENHKIESGRIKSLTIVR